MPLSPKEPDPALFQLLPCNVSHQFGELPKAAASKLTHSNSIPQIHVTEDEVTSRKPSELQESGAPSPAPSSRDASPSRSNTVSNSLSRDAQRIERRVLEEALRLMEEGGLYYCEPVSGGDLTNCVQRTQSQLANYLQSTASSPQPQPQRTTSSSPSPQIHQPSTPDPQHCSLLDSAAYQRYKAAVPVWERAHDEFFWNRALLADLLELARSSSLSFKNKALSENYADWIVPVVCGYVASEKLLLDPLTNEVSLVSSTAASASASTPTEQPPKQQVSASEPTSNTSSSGGAAKQSTAQAHHVDPSKAQFSPNVGPFTLTFTLISRRSRFRAGVRYRRRGIDASGHVANFVETEQVTFTLTLLLHFLLHCFCKDAFCLFCVLFIVCCILRRCFNRS